MNKKPFKWDKPVKTHFPTADELMYKHYRIAGEENFLKALEGNDLIQSYGAYKKRFNKTDEQCYSDFKKYGYV